MTGHDRIWKLNTCYIYVQIIYSYDVNDIIIINLICYLSE